MKKIFMDISFYNVNKTGLGAYACTLLDCFSLNKINFYKQELILPRKFRFKYILLMLWQNIILYIKTLILKPDIIIFPTFTIPYLTRKNTKYVTVIHDLCHLRNSEMTSYFKNLFTLFVNIAVKKADIIVTVSNTIRQEIINTLDISPDKIKVIYNSVANHFIDFNDNSEILNKYNIKNKKYILSVATLNRRKNVPELIRAFESIADKYPELKLVLVGGMGNEQREKLTKLPNIIFTGHVDKKDLTALYKKAFCYIFPSIYEGFGIPIIDAQTSGIPIICSDIPVFREVAGDGALFAKLNTESFTKELEKILEDKELRDSLIVKGYENQKRFSIENIKEQLRECLK